MVSTVHELDELRALASENSALLPYVIRLELIRNLIEEKCPDKVVLAFAYGNFLRLRNRKAHASQIVHRNGMEILTVTTMKNFYKAHVLLAEKVFGPVLYEFGRLTTYHIWTQAEFKTAIRENAPIWRSVKNESVLIYGSPSREPE